MDIHHLHRLGLSQRVIARKLGISRPSVKKYLNNLEAAVTATFYSKRESLVDPYKDNIKAWLDEDFEYRATWIYDRMVSMGFTGSYEIVKRQVREFKKERQQIAYMRFETEPGYQAQVDFGEFQVERTDGVIEKYYLFAMILGYSRKIYAELVKKCDLPTFLDCHIRAFEYFGGVPATILYDRMKNVFIGKVAGKSKFNDTLMGFALHYGFKPEVAPAYAAWVKGKVERPYRFIREGFWRGYGFIYLDGANQDLWKWIAEKDKRIHGTTHEMVSDRFEKEKPHLTPLPNVAFDTSWRIYRNVYKDCTVRFECNSYVLPHQLVGKQVILRVKDENLSIFLDDALVVVYRVPEGKGHLVQDLRFYAQLKKDRKLNERKYGQGCHAKGRAKKTISPVAPLYDMDVEIRPVSVYDHMAGEVAA